jgi:lipoate-protein ligase A
MNLLIKCPCGFRFPVNPKKHLNRDYRICSRCGRYHKRKIFGKGFKPNREYAERRKQRKEQSRQKFIEQLRTLRGIIDPDAVRKYLTKKFSWEED